MATVSGLTAARMLEIEAASVVDGEIVGDNLILTKHDATTINAGNVRGPQGPAGPTGPAGPVPSYVTSLPGSPSNGDEIYLVLSAALGLLGHFRYNSGSASPYKWEAVGKQPELFDEITAIESTANGAYVALTTAGPSIALPYAGDYMVEIGAHIQSDASGGGGNMSYDIGATGAVDADNITHFAANTATVGFNASRARRKNALTAVTLTAKYNRTGAGNATFRSRWMKATPIRIG